MNRAAAPPSRPEPVGSVSPPPFGEAGPAALCDATITVEREGGGRIGHLCTRTYHDETSPVHLCECGVTWTWSVEQ